MRVCMYKYMYVKHKTAVAVQTPASRCLCVDKATPRSTTIKPA